MAVVAPVRTSLELLTQLRETTSSQHAELDRAVNGGEASLSPPRYTALLGASLDVLRALERDITRWLRGFDQARRVEQLRADLHVLGLSTIAMPAERVPLDTLSEAWGAAYVVEGSALGGLVLARQLERDVRVDARALSYVRLRGADTAAHWRSFCSALNAWGAQASERERADACSSARNVFRAYRTALETRLSSLR